jgi:hypothetical protein
MLALLERLAIHLPILFKYDNRALQARRKSVVPRPVPGGGRPKPPVKPKVQVPKCRTIYPYLAQDTDELGFEAGEMIEIISEGMDKLRVCDTKLSINYRRIWLVVRSFTRQGRVIPRKLR